MPDSSTLRTTPGATHGRFVVQNNHHEWAGYAGLAVTSERFNSFDSEPGQEAELNSDCGVVTSLGYCF